MYGISTTGDGLTKSRVTSNPTRISMISAAHREVLAVARAVV
jgi:hypothetical protein